MKKYKLKWFKKLKTGKFKNPIPTEIKKRRE